MDYDKIILELMEKIPNVKVGKHNYYFDPKLNGEIDSIKKENFIPRFNYDLLFWFLNYLEEVKFISIKEAHYAKNGLLGLHNNKYEIVFFGNSNNMEFHAGGQSLIDCIYQVFNIIVKEHLFFVKM